MREGGNEGRRGQLRGGKEGGRKGEGGIGKNRLRRARKERERQIDRETDRQRGAKLIFPEKTNNFSHGNAEILRFKPLPLVRIQ